MQPFGLKIAWKSAVCHEKTVYEKNLPWDVGAFVFAGDETTVSVYGFVKMEDEMELI